MQLLNLRMTKAPLSAVPYIIFTSHITPVSE